ncbi:hypothetical protein GQ457_02G029800 [Hibiscus cannabinus]
MDIYFVAVFRYTAGAHSVYKLGLFLRKRHNYLVTAGIKWYICGVDGHCEGGQKLKITVLDGAAPAPAPVAHGPDSTF